VTDEPNQQSQDKESSGEAFGQEDIDALVNQGGETEPAPEEPSAPVESVEQDGGGAIGQSDIDALMNGGGESAATPEASEATAESAEQVDGGAVSQADIDALMNGGGSADPEAPAEAAPDERLDSLGRPFDEAAAAMQAAMDEEAATDSAASAGVAGPEPTSLELGEIGPETQSSASVDRVTMLNDVNLNVEIELGRTRMLVEDVLALGEGSVVELEKLAGDPVDVFVNKRLIARGEVLVLNDNFCVRISEVLSNDPHRIST